MGDSITPRRDPSRRRFSRLRTCMPASFVRSVLDRDEPDGDPVLATMKRLIARSPSPMAMMIGRRGGLVVNERARALLAEGGGEVDGRSVWDLRSEAAAVFAAALERGLAGEPQCVREQPIRMVEEGVLRCRWFHFDFTPIEGEGGEPAAVLGIATDVSLMVRRIRALSESEQRLRLAIEGAGMIGVWTFDLETGEAAVDANVARIYGLPVEACEAGVPRARILNAIHPEDRGRVTGTFTEAVEACTPCCCKYRVTTAVGPDRWVITSAKPTRDESGKVARILGVVVDVTDQMETADALAESRFQFQTLTETLPQIVWSCQADGRHDYFSTRWSEFTGIDRRDITEDTWKRLVFPEHAAMVAEAWETALRTGRPYDIEYRFRHWTGEYRWLRVMALPIRGDDGRITRWFGTSTDVHEAYLLAEDRENLARELQRIASEDALTGVLTRRAFIDGATAMLRRDSDARPWASLLMLDVDHFKAINDAHGHPAGDRVLATAAERLRAAVRKQDLVGRLGGEEFAVYLPDCSRAEALDVAERIRIAIESEPIALVGGGAVAATVSVGATSEAGAGQTLDRLLGTADRALYQAKAGGRNRTVFAEPGLD